MKNKIFYFIILMSFIMSCSKDEGSVDQEVKVSLNLELIKSNSFSADFSLHYDDKIENLSLIWGNTSAIDINNKIGEKKLTSTDTKETISNLAQKTTYYFRLVGTFGGKEIMSNIISTTTSEIKLTFNKKIYFPKPVFAKKVLSVSDGFIIGAIDYANIAGTTSIEIIKLDKNCNLLWSFNIDEREVDNLVEIINLKDGTYMAFLYGNKNTSLGTYNTKTYAVKFNNKGEKLWTKYYNYQNNEDWTFWFNGLLEINAFEDKIVLMQQVDTTYYKDGDQFYREIALDKEGKVINEKLIAKEIGFNFFKLTYDRYGNKYNVGRKDPNPNDMLVTNDALIEKYDSDNKLVWSHLYGDSGDDGFENFVENGKSLVAIGVDDKPTESRTEWDQYRWVFCTDLQGFKLWDYQEHRKDFLYSGKDVITDSEGNTLALFIDVYFPSYQAYNLATLLKFNNKGDLMWKYEDGEDFNKDEFRPVKVFYENGDYLIFGNNDNEGLWLKTIRVE